MPNGCSRTNRIALGACALALLASGAAHAEPKDASATTLADLAMKTDFVAGKYKPALYKLLKALKVCGRRGCSKHVLAGLHRDLATVYIVGLKQTKKGKAELSTALSLDPNVQLERDLVPEDLRAAFVEAGGNVGAASGTESHEAEAAPEPKSSTKEEEPSAKAGGEEAPPGEEKPAEEKPSESSKPEEDAGASEEAESKAAPSKGETKKNWGSLSVQQEFMTYPNSQGACNPGSQFTCFLEGSPYSGPFADTANSGNEVRSGVGLATTRVLAGFDRLFGSNITLGVRLGIAFRGAPATANDKFQPLHAELRASYWFGSAPFAGTGLRPYAGLAAGIAEVDGHVPVDYFPTNADVNTGNKGTLDAWRKAGRTFVSIGGGVMIPVADRFGIVPELRIMQMLGVSGTVVAGSAGAAMGF